ncbi:MAG TPA: phosphopantothenoylcysteine decarboxylase, partial [Candidatus Sulfomarinibacteraceae bacterium]|nr:phosphopantothenoylcysteine decarboxylase [Candidatus Sulfomarinibacteraceae bacterium]
SAMDDWDFSPPPPSGLGDHDVPQEGLHLRGKRVALLVTGGIAAMKAPFIARALRRQGADVVAFASSEGLRYVAEEALSWSTTHSVVTRLTPAAEHLSDDAPFDAYLVAPATYNTINKMRHGIADTVITATLGSALGRMEQGRTQVLVAPTMHGSLHTNILTESLRVLDGMGVRIIPPREDYGKHNIPEEERLVAEVCRAVSQSPLKGRRVLVTGGPTPVPIDAVRRITNRFSGRLGILVADELFLRGAEALLIHAGGATQPPGYLPHRTADTFDDYLALVMGALDEDDYEAGVFTAAVADYRPQEVREGKTPSGGALNTITLVPTPKVIRRVRQAHPDLHMVTFKFEEGVSHEALMETARQRLQEGSQTVVANRGEEAEAAGRQVAYLVTAEGESPRLLGKRAIARAIAEHLEAALATDRPAVS